MTVEGQLVDRSNGERVRTKPKSKAGKRVVSIDPITCAALEAQLDTWSASGPDGAIFTAETGGVPTRTTLNRRWQVGSDTQAPRRHSAISTLPRSATSW